MKRVLTALALLGLLAATAQAEPADPKTLAQFDLGFARCEKLYPHMSGHRDEAYLSLWKVQADAKTRAELAKVRKGDAYRKQRQAALKTQDTSSSPEIEAKLKTQCQATWVEHMRNKPAPKP